jgi:hypothetical protein
MNKLKEKPGNESAKKTDDGGMVMPKSHLRHGRCDCLIVFKLEERDILTREGSNEWSFRRV